MNFFSSKSLPVETSNGETSSSQQENPVECLMNFEQRVQERAYFIWKNTGCCDPKQNYFQALREEEVSRACRQSSCQPCSPRMNDQDDEAERMKLKESVL